LLNATKEERILTPIAYQEHFLVPRSHLIASTTRTMKNSCALLVAPGQTGAVKGEDASVGYPSRDQQ
jgi:hypothetical protein